MLVLTLNLTLKTFSSEFEDEKHILKLPTFEL